MRNRRIHLPTTLTLLSLALASSLAFAPRADRISFEPESDSTVSRAFTFQVEMHLDDQRLRVDGQEIPTPVEGLDDGFAFEGAMDVLDRFVSARNGRPIELVRTYESITFEGGVAGQTESMDNAADLVDKPIRFLWDDDAEAYDVTYAEDGQRGDSALLEGLHPDMDFTVLLPGREVSPGDTWTAAGDELAWLFAPGGVLGSVEDDDLDVWQHFEDSLMPQLEEAFRDFVVDCTYTGRRKEGDVEVGEITFSFRSSAPLDLTDMIESIISEQMSQFPMDIDFDIRVSLELEFEGSGVLLWDLAAQRSHSMTMTNDIAVLLEAEADIDAEGESTSAEMTLELSGTGNWKMTTD